MDYKQKALDHVRSVCPELMELSFGCVVKTKNSHWQFQVVRDCLDDRWLCFELDKRTVSYLPEHNIEIIGHTPHLEHWLRGLEQAPEENKPTNHLAFQTNGEWGATDELLSYFGNGKYINQYNLTKDGENQSSEFYKAYVEIVGV